MSRDSFDTWRRRRIAAGQRQLADSIRTLIFRADPAVFDSLDFADDAQFLQPALFAYFTDTAPRTGLQQVLFGPIAAEGRAARVRVDTDAVPGTRIAVATEIDPLFQRFLEQPETPPLPAAAAARAQCSLMLALDLMRVHAPSVWAEIAGVTRLIVLYAAAAPRSFAALSAHGAIFCNTTDGDGEICLLEDVAHQGAHVLFNAMAHDPASLLAVDPRTPIGDPSETLETRPLYEALHGLFTYTVICRVLAGACDGGALAERQSREALGRLGFTLQKFATDLRLLCLPDAYTLAGRRCYQAFAAQHDAMLARYGSRVEFRYDNQPYVFDYARFVERNGGPHRVLSAVAS